MVRDRELRPACGELRVELDHLFNETNRFLGRRRLLVVAQLAGTQQALTNTQSFLTATSLALTATAGTFQETPTPTPVAHVT